MRLLLLSAWVLAVVSAFGQTTAEMTRDAAAELKEAEALEAKILSALRANLEPEQQKRLDEAEKAWQDYRDLSVALTRDMYEGGSAAGLFAIGTQTQLTVQRAEALKGYFAEGYEESDDPAVEVDPKSLIVPGVSVGALRLGMSRDDVRNTLGAPGEETAAIWRYTSAKTGNRLTMYFGTDGALIQAAWTSDSFKTAESVSTTAPPGLVDVAWFVYSSSKDHKQFKYVSAESGLAFYYTFPSGARDGEPSAGIGCIFDGENPAVEIVSWPGEPDNGWIPAGR